MADDAAGPGCAALATALDEPLAGTALTAPRWLGLEAAPPWPRDPVKHANPDVSAFLVRAAAAGFRPVLFRRTGSDAPVRDRLLVLADTDPAAAAASTLTVADPARLAELELPGPGSPLPGTPLATPLLLVCADDRDPCCAAGSTLATALRAAGEPHVWECSHLGGHRFAPTALVLPTGYTYGRLDPAAAAAVLAAAARGEVIIEGCRGRSTYSAEGQLADLAVRARSGLRAADAVIVGEQAGDSILVTDSDGQSWTVDVASEPGDVVRPASCGARPTLMSPLRATAARALPGTGVRG